MIDKLLADTALHTCDLSISNVLLEDTWMGLRDIQQTPKFSVSEQSYIYVLPIQNSTLIEFNSAT